MVSALVLTGCSGGKNGQTDKNTASQPPQLSAQFGTGEVDIADYKIFWNGGVKCYIIVKDVDGY